MRLQNSLLSITHGINFVLKQDHPTIYVSESWPIVRSIYPMLKITLYFVSST